MVYRVNLNNYTRILKTTRYHTLDCRGLPLIGSADVSLYLILIGNQSKSMPMHIADTLISLFSF